MNKLAALGIALLCNTQLYSQKTNFGISLGFIADYNWNKPLQDFQHPFLLPNVNLQSRLPLNVGILFEKQYSNISPSVGLNFIQRNLVYSQKYTNLVTFSHQTIELPVNLTKRKKISNDAHIIMNIGGGLNYILTPTSKTQTGFKINDSLVYEFSIINPYKLNGFINAGIGIENKLGDIGIIQIKFRYVYHISAILKYDVYSSGFIQTTNPFRNNYATIGLTYFPSFSKANKIFDQTHYQ